MADAQQHAVVEKKQGNTIVGRGGGFEKETREYGLAKPQPKWIRRRSEGI